MKRVTLKFGPGILVVFFLGCSQEPRSLKACLLQAAKLPSTDAMLFADRMCRELFNYRDTGEGLPFGALYYTSTNSCVEIDVDRDGRSNQGFCAKFSVFERSVSGDVSFTCLGYNRTDKTVVREVGREQNGLKLSVNGEAAGFFYYTLAACERRVATRNQEKEQQSTQDNSEDVAASP